MNANFLKKVADVIDALADQTDKQASELREIKQADRRQQLEPLLAKLSGITGDSVSDLEAKLAAADAGLIEMLGKLAGDVDVTQLGGPDHRKVASYQGGGAEAAFADWITS